MWRDFASLAIDHYVIGHRAAQHGCVQVSGKQFHLAVELQLKGGLLKAGHVSEASADSVFKSKEYSHSLPKLWTRFKACYPMADLPTFDALVERIDRWEQTRYPKRGRRMYIQARGVALADSSNMYTLHLEDLDRFMRRTWELIGINPEDISPAMRCGGILGGASAYEDDLVRVMHA